VTEQQARQVQALSPSQWLAVRARALQAEAEAALAHFNLLGQTWTGKVAQVQAA